MGLASLALATLMWGFSSCFVGIRGGARSARTVMGIGHGYTDRKGARKHDPGYKGDDSLGAADFTSAQATGATAEVAFKKRPFGILRYAPGAPATTPWSWRSSPSRGIRVILRARP